MGFKWPKNWSEKPQLLRVDENTAYFGDGTSAKIDAIILCTGYLHHFPFIEDGLRLRTHNCLYPLGLYQGVVWERIHVCSIWVCKINGTPSICSMRRHGLSAM